MISDATRRQIEAQLPFHGVREGFAVF